MFANSDAYMSGILATTKDAIISMDADQRIVLFNTGAEQVFGYTESEVRGKSIEFLIPPAFRAQHASHVHAFEREAPASRMMDERMEIAATARAVRRFPPRLR